SARTSSSLACSGILRSRGKMIGSHRPYSAILFQSRAKEENRYGSQDHAPKAGPERSPDFRRDSEVEGRPALRLAIEKGHDEKRQSYAGRAMRRSFCQ